MAVRVHILLVALESVLDAAPTTSADLCQLLHITCDEWGVLSNLAKDIAPEHRGRASTRIRLHLQILLASVYAVATEEPPRAVMPLAARLLSRRGCCRASSGGARERGAVPGGGTQCVAHATKGTGAEGVTKQNVGGGGRGLGARRITGYLYCTLRTLV
ncbi:hypothetical protein DFH27DRAFT_641477 [Peziza echinospora]|nr:hypothetical protein DFH27DRAFT_641477 [Peziza echinospora]